MRNMTDWTVCQNYKSQEPFPSRDKGQIVNDISGMEY